MPRSKTVILEQALLDAKALEETIENQVKSNFIKENAKKIESIVMRTLQEKRRGQDDDEINLEGDPPDPVEPGGEERTPEEMAADAYASPSSNDDVFNDDLPTDLLPDFPSGGGTDIGGGLPDDDSNQDVQKATFVVPDDLFAEPDQLSIAFDSNDGMITIDFGDSSSDIDGNINNIAQDEEFDVESDDEDETLPDIEDNDILSDEEDEEEEDEKDKLRHEVRKLHMLLTTERIIRKRSQNALKETLFYNKKLSTIIEINDKIGILPKDLKLEFANRIDEAKTTKQVENVAKQILSETKSDDDGIVVGDKVRTLRKKLTEGMDQQISGAHSESALIDPKFIRMRELAGLKPIKR